MSVEDSTTEAVQEAIPGLGDAQASSAPDDSVSAIANEIGVDEDTAKMFMDNDPDIRDKLIKPAQGEGATGKEGSEDHGAGEGSGENSAADGQKEASAADGKDSGGEEQLEFADDVIPGLKGEVFGKLPKEAQEAVAEFYGAVQEKSKKLEATEAALNALKQDPYLKSRIAAAESGMQMQMRRLTPEEKNSLGARLAEKMGLVLTEPADVEILNETIADIEAGIATVAQGMAQDYAAKTLAAQEAITRLAETNKRGNELMRGLSTFNKSLEVKEADLSKFYKFSADGKVVYNDAHPEIEKFKGGLGRYRSGPGTWG